MMKWACEFTVLFACAGAPSLQPAEEPKPFGPIPSAAQLRRHEMKFCGFDYFAVNTFTGKEVGYGNEPETAFNPLDFDADKTVKAFQDGGMNGVILTAKHQDGLCLLPSKVAEHSVKHSPRKGGKGDMVKEIAEARRPHGLKFGI
jgi:alpha-L-fucosidase